MIILGIDPGYAILGYGIIDAEGRKIRPVDYGVIETKAGEPFPERLEKLLAFISRSTLFLKSFSFIATRRQRFPWGLGAE